MNLHDSVLMFLRQEIKEEMSFASFAFQCIDENPKWNSTNNPSTLNGFDLMTLQAGGDVDCFGRLLGPKWFSSGEDSGKILSPQKSSDKNRLPVSRELSDKFKNQIR